MVLFILSIILALIGFFYCGSYAEKKEKATKDSEQTKYQKQANIGLIIFVIGVILFIISIFRGCSYISSDEYQKRHFKERFNKAVQQGIDEYNGNTYY